MAFVLRRAGRALISLAIVVVATFATVHLVPGDPVRATLGPSATPELVASTRAQLGLDESTPRQLLDYVSGLPRGDLGVSLQTDGDVGATLAERLPATLSLALLAIGLAALFGIALGVLPVAGWGSLDQAVLPVVALALGPMAYLARIVHVEMLAVLDTPYLTTARGKRLPARLLYLRHALPNMITGALTAGGLVLTGMVAGTVVIETVFAVPGLGTTIVSSITSKDYPMIQGVVLVYAALVLALNLLVDLVLATVDPRSSIMEG